MKKAYLLYVAVFFALGEIIGKSAGFLKDSPLILLSLGFIFFIILLASVKKEPLFIISLFALFAILGTMRYDAFNATPKNHIKNLVGRKVILEIEITSDPLDGGGLKAEGKMLILPHQEEKQVCGKMLVRIRGSEKTAYRYGDILRATGTLREIPRYPLGKSDYRKFLANKKIYAMLSLKKGSALKIGEVRSAPAKFVRFIYIVREKLSARVRVFFGRPYSGIVEALFLGKRGDLPKPLKESLSKTGTFHILAISGLHVGIIYFILRLALKVMKVNPKAAIILSVLFLACYAILTGARPSILRATVMFSFLSLGGLFGRKTSVYNLIGISALLILFFNPNQLFEIGFVLSYGAVLSIVYISPKIYRLLGSAKSGTVAAYLKGAISVSFAAWAGLLGVVAYYFGIIAPVTVIANILIVPLLFVIMGAGILFFIPGIFCKYMAVIFAGSTTFFIFLLVKIVEFLRNLPCAYFNVYGWDAKNAITYYVLLLGIIIICGKIKEKN